MFFLAFIPPMGAIVDDHNPLTGNSIGIRHFDFIIKGVESNPEKKKLHQVNAAVCFWSIVDVVVMTLVDILGLLPKVVAWNNIGWDIWAPISCFWYFQMNSTKLISYWKELTPWDNVFYLQIKSLDVQSPPPSPHHSVPTDFFYAPYASLFVNKSTMQDPLTTPTWLSWCQTRRPPLLCTMSTSKISTLTTRIGS